MSVFERLLVSGTDELPDCRCGEQMQFADARAVPDRCDAHIRVFTCPSCDHELRLTVWSADATV